MSRSARVLVAPLDWGLGHATRCVPIIRELLSRKCEVVITGSGSSAFFLKMEFPTLTHYLITGYKPQYASGQSMALPMVLQIPKFLNTIRAEHNEIERIVKKENIDIILSDNRYGAWSSKARSIFITHQLNIRVPGILSRIVRKINHQYIHKFAACWVPDFPGAASLAGELSFSRTLAVTHIGPLSRFSKNVRSDEHYKIMALVSGPEPQRKILEVLLREQLMAFGKPALLVAGVPEVPVDRINGAVREVNHLASTELNKAIMDSDIVISRPGYSTIMDLATLGKKAIFIPTPGQTEQEYLGKRMMERGIVYCAPQRRFELSAALEMAKSYSGFVAAPENRLLSDALDTLLL